MLNKEIYKGVIVALYSSILKEKTIFYIQGRYFYLMRNGVRFEGNPAWIMVPYLNKKYE